MEGLVHGLEIPHPEVGGIAQPGAQHAHHSPFAGFVAEAGFPHEIAGGLGGLGVEIALDRGLQIRDHHAKNAARFQNLLGVEQGPLAVGQAEMLQHMGAVHPFAAVGGHGQALDDVAVFRLLGKKKLVAGEYPSHHGCALDAQPGGTIKIPPPFRDRQPASVLHIA